MPSAPASIRSQEEIVLPEAQLRREARSPEESPSSYEGCPCRSRRANDIATSDELSFVGGQLPHPPPAPANILPQEDSISPEPQLRRGARSPEESTNSDKVCLRRSRRANDITTSDELSFVGGQSPHPRPSPASILSQEDSRLPETQLRREPRSPEESTNSRKGYPRRSRRAYDDATSAEPSFIGR